MGIAHAERHTADRWAMFGGKVRGDAFRFVVQDQVDTALTVQVHLFGTVRSNLGETEYLQNRLEYARCRRCQLDELEAHQAHWIFENICHVLVLIYSEKLVISGDVEQNRR
ncbi:hypothetical protein D3C79_910420 [compost metagenome]